MKQKFLLLAMALLGCMNVVQAKDGVTIGDVTIKQGGFGCISINCSFQTEGIYYNAFQIEFVLPKDENGKQIHFNQGKADASKCGIFDNDAMFIFNDKKENKPEGSFIFMNFLGQELNHGDYELVKIYFKADEDMKTGTYPVTITALSLSGDDGKDYSPFNTDENYQITTNDDLTFNVTIVDGGPRVLSDTATKLPEDNYSYVKDTWEEVQENGKTKYKKISSETFFVPEDFKVERTINANTWSTMCLPFKMSFAEALEAFGEDAQIAVWWVANNPVKYDSQNNTIDLNFLPLSKTWPEETLATYFDSRKPFLIKTSKAFSSFIVKDKYIGDYNEEKNTYTSLTDLDTSIKVQGAFDPISGTMSNNSFVGVFTAGKVPEGALFFSGNKFYYSTGRSDINAFRAYLILAENLNPKAIDGSANVGILINDVPTYVEGISTKSLSNDNVYSVSGINMGTESDLKHMKPGMYIVNGKKVIVK